MPPNSNAESYVLNIRYETEHEGSLLRAVASSFHQRCLAMNEHFRYVLMHLDCRSKMNHFP